MILHEMFRGCNARLTYNHNSCPYDETYLQTQIDRVKSLLNKDKEDAYNEFKEYKNDLLSSYISDFKDIWQGREYYIRCRKAKKVLVDFETENEYLQKRVYSVIKRLEHDIEDFYYDVKESIDLIRHIKNITFEEWYNTLIQNECMELKYRKQEMSCGDKRAAIEYLEMVFEVKEFLHQHPLFEDWMAK